MKTLVDDIFKTFDKHTQNLTQFPHLGILIYGKNIYTYSQKKGNDILIYTK